MTSIYSTAVDISDFIDAERIAEETLAFVRVRSETGDEGAAAEFFAELLRREGFEPRLDPVEPGRPNVYARWAGSGGGPALLFNGHTDTIPGRLGPCGIGDPAR
jgi:acetylornithine deacetylase